jgi:hypothetical protein
MLIRRRIAPLMGAHHVLIQAPGVVATIAISWPLGHLTSRGRWRLPRWPTLPTFDSLSPHPLKLFHLCEPPHQQPQPKTIGRYRRRRSSPLHTYPRTLSVHIAGDAEGNLVIPVSNKVHVMLVFARQKKLVALRHLRSSSCYIIPDGCYINL